ncbi:MAG: penicillin-binding protein 1B [Thermodesulfobacteriota bacterium]|nr:penicillin-binding protein 1B [Thermodesulfobacteriota bacterium]
MASRKKKNTTKRAGKKNRTGRFPFVTVIVFVLVVIFVAFALYVKHLDRVIRQKFDGKRWSLPAVVYARPLELYPGLSFSTAQLEKELQLAGYRREDVAADPGGYDRDGDLVHLITRDFYFPDGLQKSVKLTVQFAGDRIESIAASDSRQRVSLARLDPARIGSFHPRHHEDRIVLTIDDLPELLVKTLLAVEDQDFYSHSGLSFRGIARALLANIRAGETVQGGSTLSQQLVKNFFLSNKRTLQRKFNEAIMTLLLEFHYSKDEILTAYTNEVFLGQDGARAVHGFGLAGQFYFRRDLEDLDAAQIALLVGMVKGPSYYNPRKYPDRCLKRRQLVLDMMFSRAVIDEDVYQQARTSTIETTGGTKGGFNRFPAFLDLVRRQLRLDYLEKDLTTDGLKILTTLDPQVQWQVEKNLAETIDSLEKRAGVSEIEGAVIVSSREGGEILAVAGGRKPLQTGFNRAIDARRPIGSIIKPAVYLTAFANGSTLASPVQDSSLAIDDGKGGTWRPKNFDGKEHGLVPLYAALAHSYNQATVKIGMDVGLEKVQQTVRDLGVDKEFSPYPSFLLGAASMVPLEVSQMYQTLAAGGFYVPQRVIGSVLSSDKKVLQRFGLSVEQRFSPESIYLLNTALQLAVREGTGKSLSRSIPPSHNLAGKTGTSNDLRDSWFAGFSGDKLSVVWLGRDDNKTTGLTGASGALAVWGKIMQSLHAEPLDLLEPPGIEWAWVDPESFDMSGRFHYKKIKLPFIAGSIPKQSTVTPFPVPEKKKKGPGVLDRIRDWFR